MKYMLTLVLGCFSFTAMHARVSITIDMKYNTQQITQAFEVADTDEQEFTCDNVMFSVSTLKPNKAVILVLRVYELKNSGRKKLLAQPTLILETQEPAELIIDGPIKEQDMELHITAKYTAEAN